MQNISSLHYTTSELYVASISRLSPSKRTNCSVTFDPPSKVTLQFVRLEGESLEIEAKLYAHHTFVILDLCLPRVGLKGSAAGEAREKPGCSTTSTPMRTFSGLTIAQHHHSVG